MCKNISNELVVVVVVVPRWCCDWYEFSFSLLMRCDIMTVRHSHTPVIDANRNGGRCARADRRRIRNRFHVCARYDDIDIDIDADDGCDESCSHYCHVIVDRSRIAQTAARHRSPWRIRKLQAIDVIVFVMPMMSRYASCLLAASMKLSI